MTIAGQAGFATQLFVTGEALNANDMVLSGVRDAAQRASVILTWIKLASSVFGELAITSEIVMNYTFPDAASAAKPSVVYQSGSSANNKVHAGVVNSATYKPGVASGAWITLDGDKLAASTRTWTAADIVRGKLPKALDGVSVSIDGKAASVYCMSPKQIHVLAPTVSYASAASITVTNANGILDIVKVDLKPWFTARANQLWPTPIQLRSPGSAGWRLCTGGPGGGSADHKAGWVADKEVSDWHPLLKQDREDE